MYLKLNNYQLAGQINQAIYKDKLFKCKTCSIDVAVFNRDVLMVGSVPSHEMRKEAVERVDAVQGKRKFYNQLRVADGREDPILDSWITGNIRSKIIGDSSIDPRAFKIVTSNQVVYIMGDVRKEQAKTVILFARETKDVRRVVKLLRYYKYTAKL
ncbi:MAG: hypothetical protein A3E88_02010 [Legionellales bacterium RIFCSPHIGHO2_12_FULL_35_11]|nr:MAG: hypothetical protein A3E88_02010 [Legionellales bacterium RIFCSPHIGHO2_12_FULL_35_11]